MSAIEPWFTAEEAGSIASDGRAVLKIEGESEKLGLKMAAIAQALSLRGQERAIMSDTGLGGKINVRREEAVLAVGAKPAPRAVAR